MYASKNTIKKMKRQPIEWKNFASLIISNKCVSNKRLVTRINITH